MIIIIRKTCMQQHQYLCKKANVCMYVCVCVLVCLFVARTTVHVQRTHLVVVRIYKEANVRLLVCLLQCA